MTHPGDGWPRFCPARHEKPTLWLEENRSIFVAWPPTASCERCHSQFPEGYVGPAVGDVVRFPDAATHFICEPCARALLGLRPEELADENCITPGCSGNEHENMAIASRTDLPADATEEAAVAYFSTEYGARGWRVTSAVPDPTGPRALDGQAWRIFFTSARKLW
jgi:hypothetical protein